MLKIVPKTALVADAPLPEAIIITRYNYTERAKNAPGISFPEPSLTNQADMEAADINKIMARYEKTGFLIDPLTLQNRQPTYGDFTEVKNYHQMMIGIRNVENAFGTLPANLRNRFKNDPQELINFLEDPKNDDEAVKMGLKHKDVLLTELDLDGVTKITALDKAGIDSLTPEQKLARVAMLKKQAETPAGSGATPPAGTATNV